MQRPTTAATVSTAERRFARVKEEQRGVVQRGMRNGFLSSFPSLVWWFCGSWVSAKHWRRFGWSTNQHWRHWTKVVERGRRKESFQLRENSRWDAAHHFDGLQNSRVILFTQDGQEWIGRVRMNRTRKTIGSVNETLCICENEATYFQRARAWSMNSIEHDFGLMKRCTAKKEKFVF